MKRPRLFWGGVCVLVLALLLALNGGTWLSSGLIGGGAVLLLRGLTDL